MKYLVIFLTGLLFFIVNPASITYNSICLGLILLFGIPHGAADHKVNESITKNSSTFKYVLKYLLIACGYIFWWLIMPGKALVIFIILSAYHFGQEFLENLKIETPKVWEIVLWGTIILIVPLMICYEEVRPSLEFVTKSNLPELPATLLLFLSALIIALGLFHMYFNFGGTYVRLPVFPGSVGVLEEM